jgi:hypothetical protein
MPAVEIFMIKLKMLATTPLGFVVCSDFAEFAQALGEVEQLCSNGQEALRVVRCAECSDLGQMSTPVLHQVLHVLLRQVQAAALHQDGRQLADGFVLLRREP